MAQGRRPRRGAVRSVTSLPAGTGSIAYDRRGYGRSVVTADRQTVSTPDETNQEDSGEEDGQPEALFPMARNGT